MKERGIPYAGPMVRAIIARRKRMTRRELLLPADAFDVGYWTTPSGRPQKGYADPGIRYRTVAPGGIHIDPFPYGFVGDRLWVREAWRTAAQWDHLSPKQLPVFGSISQIAGVHIDYLADEKPKTQHGRYRHPRFMPRCFSRIDLQITDIRVERLLQISPEDAIAEGIENLPGGQWKNYLCKARTSKRGSAPVPEHREIIGYLDPVLSFRSLWEMINGIGSWEKNPWVGVIRFELL